jgi:outer membrane usher protein
VPVRWHVRKVALNAALLLAAAPHLSHAAVLVRAIRVGLDPDHSRLVLESDGPIHTRLTRDAQSGALRVDLEGVMLNSTLLGLDKAVGANNPFIRAVKLTPAADGTMLELDTPAGIAPDIFNLRPGGGHADRLVVDLLPSAGKVPAAPPPPAPRHSRLPVRVSAVRMDAEDNRVRLVLESNRPIRAAVIRPTTAGAPIAIDLGDIAEHSVLADLPGMIERNPYLSAVRLERESADTRMVLITTQPVTPQIFALPPGDGQGERLVIDLIPQLPLPVPASRSMAPAQATPAQVITAQPAPVPTETVPAETVPALPSPAPSTAPTASPETTQETWFKVFLNGTSEDTVLALRDAAGHVLLQTSDLKRWRIRVRGVPRVKHDGDEYCPLAAVNGLSYRIVPSQGALQLTVSPGLLEASRFSGVSGGPMEPTPPPPGAYLDYDVYADRERGSTDAGALVETSVFGRYGNVDTTMLARDTNGRKEAVRLDTTWTQDHPAQMASLRIGDSISGASGWGRSIRFGGVQWATNFATQPTFITLPTLTLHGVAAAPSTVDYYVDNALRLRRDVPAGPFTIQDLPVITGQGQARMVVTDLLGREQVITQPFYASSGLLAKGLRDFSYELGFQRENYGLESNDYGKLAAIGTERLGLSDSFTGEAHVEITRRQQTAGIGADWLVADSGVLTAAVAAGRDAQGAGGLLQLGFQHQSAYLSYGFRTQFTTPGFAQLGYESPQRPPRQATSAYMSFGSGNSGAFGLNYTREDFRDGQPDVDFVGASYSRSLGQLGYLTLSGLRFLGDDPSSLFTLSITVPLGSRDSLSLNAQAQPGNRRGNLQYQRNLPAGSGVGYRLQAGLSPDDTDLAEVTLQNDVGTYSLGAANEHGAQAYQASVRGSVALLGGRLFPSRSIDGSFAVVQVPGFSGVRVYQDNQEVATTDTAGYALVPRLRPYQDNPIRIEQADLPLDAEIQGLQLDAVPYYHSALLLKFPVSHSRGATLTIKLRDGSFLPAGAGVTVEGNPTVFPVGMRGEVYLSGLQQTNRLHVMWHGQSCDLTLRVPEGSGPLPDLAPMTCEEIAP